jgi:aryl-alcohol dehydrogenase-like predicted oxidoreductase
MSTKFKPPKRSDSEQWAKVAALIEAGSRFDDVGEAYPERLSEVADFIARHRATWSWRRGRSTTESEPL